MEGLLPSLLALEWPVCHPGKVSRSPCVHVGEGTQSQHCHLCEAKLVLFCPQ